MRIKTRRDEGPNLPEKERHGQPDGRVQGYLYIESKGLEGGRHHQLVVDVRQLFITLAQVDRQLDVFRHDFSPGRQRFVGIEAHVSLTVLIHPGQDRRAGRKRRGTQSRGISENKAQLVIQIQRTKRNQRDLPVEAGDRHAAMLLRVGQGVLDGPRQKVVDAIGHEPAKQRGDEYKNN